MVLDYGPEKFGPQISQTQQLFLIIKYRAPFWEFPYLAANIGGVFYNFFYKIHSLFIKYSALSLVCFVLYFIFPKSIRRPWDILVLDYGSQTLKSYISIILRKLFIRSSIIQSILGTIIEAQMKSFLRIICYLVLDYGLKRLAL